MNIQVRFRCGITSNATWGVVLALLAIGFLGSAPAQAKGVTHTWTGNGATNNWNDPANWDTGKVPGVAANGTDKDNVILPPKTSDYTVQLNVDVRLNDVTIGGDGANDHAVTLNTNGHIFIYKRIFKKASGTVNRQQQSFSVNSTANAVDANPGNGVCATSTGVCTLQAAVAEVNAAPGDYLIGFNVPQSDPGFNPANGTVAFAPNGSLVFLNPVDFDARTQPLFNPETGDPLIILDGSGAPSLAPAIEMHQGGGIFGCAFRNWDDAAIYASSDATAGPTIISGNVITNCFFGIYVDQDPAFAADPYRTVIGMDPDGALPPTFFGPPLPLGGNVISGNENTGISIGGASDIDISGNYIGVDVLGEGFVGNDLHGINVFNSSNVHIGGPGRGNVISANSFSGVNVGNAGAGVFIQGNRIGTNAAGDSAVGNGRAGISIGSTPGVVIGGALPGEGNLVSGNLESGISISSFSTPPLSSNCIIRGNRIGTNAAGDGAIGNGQSGVSISNTPGVLVGGAFPGEGNLISGNTLDGIGISSFTNPPSSLNNLIQGNHIGTNAAGNAALGNGGRGISVDSPQNTIGGTAPGAGNVIWFNTQAGVAINDAGATGNAIRGNSIAFNGGLGIDLGPTGVTGNDSFDSDTGANNLQNFPVLSGTASSGSGLQVQGSLVGTSSTTFTLDFFANSAADPSGNGEGQTFLGSKTVTTNASGNATFNLSLSKLPPSGQNIITSTATDPNGNTSEFSAGVQFTPPPSIIINDMSVLEGNTGSGSVNFTVTLSSAATKTVTVNYATANGSATQPADYTTASGTLTILTGQNKGIITVPITGDVLDELDETFFVNLSNANGATISDNQGRGTIIDNDAAPTLSINDRTVIEGTGTNVNAIFTVTLSAPSGKTVSVNAITANGTAKSPADFTSGGATLTFSPGQTSKTFSVSVIGDTLDEDAETFFVLLSSAVNAGMQRARGNGIITDNDAAPSITIQDASFKEYNSGQTTATLRLTLSAPSGRLVKVNYATANGTSNPATAGNDYVAVAPTQISFTTGQTVTLARVLINGDVLNEPNETFLVNLSSPVNATIADNQGVGTILNDDTVPALSINDVSIAEGNSGTKQLVFTVSLSKASGQNVTVNYATANGTATTANSDYVAKTGSLSFAPGSALTRTVSITINGDTLVEGNETLFVLLSGQTNATISKARGIATINNDDSS